MSDAQWARIETLLPDRTPKRGGRWRDHREVIDAIAFTFQTGTQWRACRRGTATGGASTTARERQLVQEQHGGRTFEGVATRVAQRVRALAAGIRHNNKIGAPVTRVLHQSLGY
ncbi:transposase [Streptomyces sp. AC536]|nr:transposase [Streptomyces buecherae]QNJ42493.1 transposase [Streptomyces buecherae]